MKKSWRWNNEAVERSDLDSILDKVVRDLFARGDRPKHRRSGAARPPAKRRRQSFALEAIEPRLLLSADLSYTATSAGNLTLRVADVHGNQELQLVDSRQSSTLLASERLSTIDGSSGYGARIEAGGFDVTLRIDDSVETAGVKGGILFEGGAGNDVLVGADRTNIWQLSDDGSGKVGSVSFRGVDRLVGGSGEDTLAGPQADSVWNITGSGSGHLGSVEFAGIENLAGAAGNKDTFVFGAAGRLSGVVDGGAAGFDTLVLDGGHYTNVVYAATGPNSGTIERDGALLRYEGLEPIFDNLSTTNRIIRTSNFTDNARLTDSGTSLTLASVDAVPTFESITFAKPTNSLTIDLGGDNGIPFVSDTDRLEIQALTLNAALIVNGEAGKDAVTVTGNMNLSGKSLIVNAEQIAINPGVTVMANDIALNAIATLGSAGTPDNLPLATAAALITVNGALSGHDVTLTAATTYISSLTNIQPNIPLVSL